MIAAEVLAALDHEKPRSKNELVLELGRGRQKVMKAIDQLVEQEQVSKVKGGFVKTVNITGITDQVKSGSDGSENRAELAEPSHPPKRSHVVPGSPPLGGTGIGTTWEEKPPTCLRLVPTPRQRYIEIKNLRCPPRTNGHGSSSTLAPDLQQVVNSEAGAA